MKTIAPYIVLIFFLNSCVYHLGNPAMHPELKNLAISEIDNLTSESALTALFKNALSERIANEPGLHLASPDSATAANLKLTMKNLDNRSLARSKLREKDYRDYDGDAYQAVLYRISIKVEYEVYSSTVQGKLLRSGEVTGQADLPKLHDREIALRTALRQLAIDLAAELVAELSETR
ncbi:MAG: LPS assembly lipoprotein LptE [Lentisphaeria bacterium]